MKKFQVFLAFCLFVSVSLAQNTSEPFIGCTYLLQGNTYSCQLTIDNPTGFNDFTSIQGLHLEGFTDADVQQLTRLNGTSTNIPSIICQSFPNIRIFNFYNAGVTAIGHTSFPGCESIEWLRLWNNRISQVSGHVFNNLRNLTYLDLDGNSFSTLPAEVFANQENLQTLEMPNNQLNELPANIFDSLVNLQNLYLYNSNLTSINPLWFANTRSLSSLNVNRNRLSNLQENWFKNLSNLRSLNLALNGISQVSENVFRPLTNLTNLYLNGNNFSQITPDMFASIPNLNYLDLGACEITEIQNGAFVGLPNLFSLGFSSSQLRTIAPNAFEGLRNLSFLYLNFNQLEELPEGVFAELNLNYLGMWGNRMKTLARNRFGSLTNLMTLDLDGNVVNALDQRLFEDAVNLQTLYFGNNLCADGWFGSFQTNRVQHIERLGRCFRNFRYIVETTTEADAPVSFYEAPDQGIAFRVNAQQGIRISLTPFDFEWNPMLEISIGTNNNTRSSIRRNQEQENVVVIPTPGIIRAGQWNDFRITWVNQVLLVFRGVDQFPFMSFTMSDFFPVGFYGLRSIGSRASWTSQPFEL